MTNPIDVLRPDRDLSKRKRNKNKRNQRVTNSSPEDGQLGRISHHPRGESVNSARPEVEVN